MTDAPTLDVWYDVASPACYPAVMTVARRAADVGVRVRWRPAALATPGGEPDAHAWSEVEQACAAAAVPLTRPSVFPRESRPALRAALACAAEGLDVGAFSRAVLDANFARDQDISDVGRLGELLAEIDMPGAAVLQRARAPETEAALAAQTDAAARLGLAGAPGFTTPDGELFRGFDSMDQALAWAARAHAAPETA